MQSRISTDQIVDIICSATTDVLSTMFNMEMVAEPAYTDQTSAPLNDGVLAFVGLAGSSAGTGAIGCSSSFSCHLCSQMLMNEYETVNDDVLDAMGELTNMIIGNVKTRLEDELGPMALSIPTVIHGRNFSSRSIGNADWTIVPFRHGEERLLVQVCLVPEGQGRRPRIALADSLGVTC